MKTIAIYFKGSPNFAGTEIFFINVATALIHHGDQVIVFDYPTSAVPRRLKELNLPFLFQAVKDDVSIAVPVRVDHLIATCYDAFDCLRLDLGANCHLTVVELDKSFWIDRHTSAFSSFAHLLYRHWRQFLLSSHAIAILEKDSIRRAQADGYAHAEAMPIIPLPVRVPEHCPTRRHQHRAPFRFVGLGRSTEIKIYPVAYFFARLRELSPTSTFSFITHQPDVAQQIFNRCGSSFVRCVPGGTPDEISRILGESADCVIAMGTSVLDAAALGIPSLIADASKEWPYPARRLRWVFESHDDLGQYVTAQVQPEYGIEIEAAFRTLADSYEDMSKQCYDAVQRDHSFPAFERAVSAALGATRLTFGAYRREPLFWLLRRLIALRGYLARR